MQSTSTIATRRVRRSSSRLVDISRPCSNRGRGGSFDGSFFSRRVVVLASRVRVAVPAMPLGSVFLPNGIVMADSLSLRDGSIGSGWTLCHGGPSKLAGSDPPKEPEDRDQEDPTPSLRPRCLDAYIHLLRTLRGPTSRLASPLSTSVPILQAMPPSFHRTRAQCFL